MAKIVAVHGIGQQLQGSQTLHSKWWPSLYDGLSFANVKLSDPNDLKCAFYGDLFRKQGTKGSDPIYGANDVTEEWEQELLMEWWYAASEVDDAMITPRVKTKGRTPQGVHRALNALCNSSFWAGTLERGLIFDLKQVSMYFHNEELRHKAIDRVTQCIGPDTKVLIGHSLGSIVAYEALHANHECPVSTFVTLGSPLGISNLTFDKLHPAPSNGIGAWPNAIQHWTNIADKGDVVALVKELRPLFGEKVIDILVHNEVKAHDILPYLTAQETGHAIAKGLVPR